MADVLSGPLDQTRQAPSGVAGTRPVMSDPLDLTIVPADGPIVDLDLRTLVVPSMEASLVPLWSTEAELSAAKRLISAVEEELRQESGETPEPAFCTACGNAVARDKDGHLLYGTWLSFRDFERILLSLGASGSDVRRLWPT